MPLSANRVATEVPGHRQPSPIGSLQRHYRLNPPLNAAGVDHHDIVTVVGAKATYAFPATGAGDVTEFEALATSHGGQDDTSLLSELGYATAVAGAA